jgi:hypothetical protein
VKEQTKLLLGEEKKRPNDFTIHGTRKVRLLAGSEVAAWYQCDFQAIFKTLIG